LSLNYQQLAGMYNKSKTIRRRLRIYV